MDRPRRWLPTRPTQRSSPDPPRRSGANSGRAHPAQLHLGPLQSLTLDPPRRRLADHQHTRRPHAMPRGHGEQRRRRPSRPPRPPPTAPDAGRSRGRLTRPRPRPHPSGPPATPDPAPTPRRLRAPGSPRPRSAPARPPPASRAGDRRAPGKSPRRTNRRAPSPISSSTTIAVLGPPSPVLWIVSGAPSEAMPVYPHSPRWWLSIFGASTTCWASRSARPGSPGRRTRSATSACGRR